MNRKKPVFISAGMSSVLLVFVLLCLIVFAALSLTSANGDYKLSQKAAERTKKYYEAETAANEKLEKIDAGLQACYEGSKDRREYEQKIREALKTWEDIELDEGSQGLEISFSCPIQEEDFLEVCLRVCWPQPGEGFYRVAAWRTEHREAWEPDRILPVLKK